MNKYVDPFTEDVLQYCRRQIRKVPTVYGSVFLEGSKTYFSNLGSNTVILSGSCNVLGLLRHNT